MVGLIGLWLMACLFPIARSRWLRNTHRWLQWVWRPIWNTCMWWLEVSRRRFQYVRQSVSNFVNVIVGIASEQVCYCIWWMDIGWVFDSLRGNLCDDTWRAACSVGMCSSHIYLLFCSHGRAFNRCSMNQDLQHKTTKTCWSVSSRYLVSLWLMSCAWWEIIAPRIVRALLFVEFLL